MKTFIKTLFFLPVLIGGLVSIMAGQATAETFSILHTFTALSSSAPYGNSDGANPSGLILSGNTVYGATGGGGSGGNGTIFKMNIDGTGFTNLHSFAAGIGSNSGLITNGDGAGPGGLILSGNTLYGTTGTGGSVGNGTVFALKTDGTGFTILHAFKAIAGLGAFYTNSDGAGGKSLVLSGNTLYGTATFGGSWGNGTVFTLGTNGTGFTTMYSFSRGPNGPFVNNDGAFPGGLILSGSTLYGWANNGGNSGNGYGSTGNGTVFSLNTDGTGFTTLYKFSASSTNSSGVWTNSDGIDPNPLILSGKTLYGTTQIGGSSDSGTAFAINIDGTSFTTLHTFTNGTDGALSYAGLILSGNTLYGTTDGGNAGVATVFAVNTDGTGFTTLHTFAGTSSAPSGYYMGPDGAQALPFWTNSDGAFVGAGVLLTNNTLYGTASGGGSQGNGTVFSLSLGISNLPQLTLFPSGRNVVLTWPTNATGFTLQSTTTLASPLWTTNLPDPVVINGQYTVTNPISGAQQFFRLAQ